jgi:hypothetical protein
MLHWCPFRNEIPLCALPVAASVLPTLSTGSARSGPTGVSFWRIDFLEPHHRGAIFLVKNGKKQKKTGNFQIFGSDLYSFFDERSS